MAIDELRARERAERRRLITDKARLLAERDGWDAVTTRRLSTEIGYSQPVIYKHFAAMEDIVEAVALDGFTELAAALHRARRRATPANAVRAAARAYVRYAAANPVLYEAMFDRTTRLHFGAEDSAAPLRAAFRELRTVVESVVDARDAETATEVLWAALHGLVALGRSGRLRPTHTAQRLDLLLARFRPLP